jgi:Tfp pilus assembly protein PilF/TolB-like protein
MRASNIFLAFLLGLLTCSVAVAQPSIPGTRTLIILPFENASKVPGIEWIGEAFSEVVGQRLNSAHVYVISRDDRVAAFDRSGIPQNVKPSRATMYRISQQLDVDYMLVGEYSFDGQTFSASAQLMDMKSLRLSPAMRGTSPLPRLLDVQNSIAWKTAKLLAPEITVNQQEFLQAAPAIRLDALEAYTRGIIAPTRPEKIRYFRDALRIHPAYPEAILQLGKAYFAARDYPQAAKVLAGASRTDSTSGEANFLLGLAAFYTGDYAQAEEAFAFCASRLPLTEIYNNVGVVAARRGKRGAAEYFQKAVEADASDPDYHFNLAVALYRAGDTPGAARQLRETLARRPTDAEARALLGSIGATTTSRIPLERIKSNYDETSYRQLALEKQDAQEAGLTGASASRHAAFHVDRGRELLARGLHADAEREFREAMQRDRNNAGAHAGLARILEARKDEQGARAQAEAALRITPNTDAFLVLARLDMEDNNLARATQSVDRALALEPGNAAAQALKRTIGDKLAEQMQSSPQQ